MTKFASRPSTQPQLWSLHIDSEFQDGVRILSVRGRIGVKASPQLAAVLTEELRAGHRRIVLDLNGVDYVSSAALSVLRDAAARAAACDTQLVLCCLPEPVRVAFELAGVMADFTIESTCDAARQG